jgi:hypothetical protein
MSNMQTFIVASYPNFSIAGWGAVTQAYNPGYLGGRDWEDPGSRQEIPYQLISWSGGVHLSSQLSRRYK